VNALIGKDSKLTVLHGYVYQYTVAVFGLIHFKTPENFSSPVQGINKPAAAFGIYPDLAAGLLFGLANGAYNTFLFVVRKKFFSFSEGKNAMDIIFGNLL